MAAIKKIDNEGLLNAAYELVRREGLSALSARKLASAASCSTQPIYENFSGMGKVIEITTQRINDEYENLAEVMCGQANAKYSAQVVAICKYAQEEKELFRHFVVHNSRGMELLDNKWTRELLKKEHNVTDEQVDRIEKAMKYYILGKAFLVNCGYQKCNEEDLAESLAKEVDQHLEYLVKHV